MTSRELEIVRLTMRGCSDKLAARELDITPSTVRNHKKSIFTKLQVSSQGQVFALFLDALKIPAREFEGPAEDDGDGRMSFIVCLDDDPEWWKSDDVSRVTTRA